MSRQVEHIVAVVNGRVVRTLREVFSERFVYERTLDWDWRRTYEHDPKWAVEMLRREAADQLSDLILEKGQFFVPDRLQLSGPDPRVRIEMTINDRGAYENVTDEARAEGAVKERKRLIASLPYGFDAVEEY